MDLTVLTYVAFVSCFVAPLNTLPLETQYSGRAEGPSKAAVSRSLWKRFIDTSSSFGGLNHNGVDKIRMRRSSEAEEQCERWRLCRLHARSASSFLAAFELYFVNKENARLWDHRARSPEDCDRRFSCDR